MKNKLQMVYPKTRTERNLYKLSPTRNGLGTKWIADGKEEIFFETQMDLEKLLHMGRRAAGNASQKCTLGPVVVTVIGRRRIG